MDWKIFITAFSGILLAELGDKTQLANLSLSAKSGSILPVFLGSCLAFAVVTLATILLGTVLSKFLKPEYVRYSAATLFVAIGVLMYLGKI